MFRAQASLEYITVLAFVLLIAAPIFYASYSQISSASPVLEASVAASVLADAADRVYAAGPQSVTVVEIFLPKGLDSTRTKIEGKGVQFGVYSSSGTVSDVFAPTLANLSNTTIIPSAVGRHFFRVSYDSSSGNVSFAEIA